MLLIQVMLIWMFRAQTRYMRTIIVLRLGPEKGEEEGKEEDVEDEEEDSEGYCGSDYSLSSTRAQYMPSSPTPSCVDPLDDGRLGPRTSFGPEKPHWARDAC